MSVTNKLTIGYILALSVIMAIIIAIAYAGEGHNTSMDLPKPLVSNEQRSAFIAGYEAQLGDVDPATESDLVAAGLTLCYVLQQNNHSVNLAWRAGVDELGLSSDQSAVVLNEAQLVFCPTGE